MFDGQKALKLVTHCRDTDDYEQYVLHEHLVYRLFNLMTPRSLRARLVKATYVDAPSGKTVAPQFSAASRKTPPMAHGSVGWQIATRVPTPTP